MEKPDEVQPQEALKEEVLVTTHKIEPSSKPVRGPQKMCPKCNKVKAYFFHTKNCKG